MAEGGCKYVREQITPESHYKLKKFIDDNKLNKIQLDKALVHIPKSRGSYIDSRTGRLTSSGNKAKEKIYNVEAQSDENEGSAKLNIHQSWSAHRYALYVVQWLT